MDWITVPQRAKDIAQLEAEQVEPFLNKRGDKRIAADRIADLYQGFIGEVMHHELEDDLAWWVKHRLSMRRKRSDLGYDTRNGENIKTILVNDRHVFVGTDDRAQAYVVYEYDMRQNKVRKLGTFTWDDIHPITLGGVLYRGVTVEEVQ